MKSLEILQEGLEFMIKAIEVNPNSVKELQSEIDIYKEAIKELKELELKFDILTVNYKCLKEQLNDECDLIKTNKEHFYFLKQNERDFIAERFKSRFQLK